MLSSGEWPFSSSSAVSAVETVSDFHNVRNLCCSFQQNLRKRLSAGGSMLSAGSLHARTHASRESWRPNDGGTNQPMNRRSVTPPAMMPTLRCQEFLIALTIHFQPSFLSKCLESANVGLRAAAICRQIARPTAGVRFILKEVRRFAECDVDLEKIARERPACLLQDPPRLATGFRAWNPPHHRGEWVSLSPLPPRRKPGQLSDSLKRCPLCGVISSSLVWPPSRRRSTIRLLSQ